MMLMKLLHMFFSTQIILFWPQQMLSKLPVDLAIRVVADWIQLNELAKLDNAFCNQTDRPLFLDLLSSKLLVHNGNTSDELKGAEYIYWLYKRKISVKSVMLCGDFDGQWDIIHYFFNDKLVGRVETLQLCYELDGKLMDIDLKIFESISMKCKSLKFLRMTGCRIQADYIPAEFSIHFTTLTELNLAETRISRKLFHMLFHKCSELKRLTIDPDYLIESSVKDMVVTASPKAFIQTLTSFPLISGLVLSSGVRKRLNDELSPSYVDASATLPILFPHLTELVFDAQTHKINDKFLFTVASHCKQLKILRMILCRHITDRGLSAVFNNCPGLVRIDVDRCIQITSASLNIMAEKNRLLESIDLCETQVTSATYFKILRNCPKLTHFPCGVCPNLGCKVPKIDGTFAMTQSKVTVVDLHCCENINDDFMYALMHTLPNITKLNLDGCAKVSNKAMIDFIKHYNTRLVDLQLNAMDKLTDSVVTTIIKYCSTNLLSVGLEDCTKISPDFELKIREAFPNCIVGNIATEQEYAHANMGGFQPFGIHPFNFMQF